jgi:hypothetical protein
MAGVRRWLGVVNRPFFAGQPCATEKMVGAVSVNLGTFQSAAGRTENPLAAASD